MAINSHKRLKSGKQRMRPRARLISLIGNELISDEPVAVVELVKNAYDADASCVSVTFRGDDPTDPDTLIVSDDGSGMSFDNVITGWFEPGTVNKKRGNISPGGRLYQGAKGIGRFAAARLAENLLMETKRVDSKEEIAILFKWGDFNDSSYLDEVEIDYDIYENTSFSYGTTLTLQSLHSRKHWTEDDFRSLHDRLSRLISPFQDINGNYEINDFKIDLTIPGYPEFTGVVESHELTKLPKYKLIGHLEKNGMFDGVLSIDKQVFKDYKDHQIGEKNETVDCGPFDIEIRAWDRDLYGLMPYMALFNFSITQTRKMLDRYCGVSMYRDGFRVHPYGEKGDDWMSLDPRSRQNPTMRLANNQIISAIRISRKNNENLIDRSTREGLVHNKEFESLKKWFICILKLLEEERYRIRPREESKQATISTLFEPFDMTDVVQEVKKTLGKEHPLTVLVKQKDSDIQEGIKKLQEHYSRVMTAAGLGQIVDIVVHEIGAPLGRANKEIVKIEKEVNKLVYGKSLKYLTERITNLKSWLELISNHREMLMPKTIGRRGHATSFSVQDEIEGNLKLFESLISRQKIIIQKIFPKNDFIVNMSRAALGQIIANLLDNSIYWLILHHGNGNGGKINIHISPILHGFILVLCDNGPGVALNDRELIFDMNFSRKPNGMGLGLYIAREIIEHYGKLIYSEDCSLPGACFEAIFEKNVGH